MSERAGAGDLEAALAQLDGARQAVYYDPAADAEARSGYYEGIEADGGAEGLFEALSSRLAQTHQRQPEYKPFLHLYPHVDLQPDGQLHSIYTGEVFAPEQLIAEDADTARRRQQATESRLSALGDAGRARAARSERETLARSEREIDDARVAVEAQVEQELPYNCEHVVPQSWFRHREPMRGDLHHLFTCERKCNEFRANHAFFDFPDFMEAVKSGCGKREENRFEPQLGKGEVARATLYFLVRYPDKVDTAAKGFDRDRLAVLLRWHAASPVSEYEHRRNAAIQTKQGNRNPFIDHPEWAERVAPALPVL